MNRLTLIATICATGLLLNLGCCDKKCDKPEVVKGPMPYQRVAKGEEDPADNGPDDSTNMDGVAGSMGSVKFTHFTHASTSEKGYGIPCQSCHHNVTDNDDSSGCLECHKAPTDGDPAHGGPDDNMILAAKDGKALPVPFNHFTHASAKGYKIPCASCHHKDNKLVDCSDCHGDSATLEEGKVVPKTKRAFHLQCKGCHAALKKSNPESIAPTGCKGCHREGVVKRMAGSLSAERAYHQSCIGCHQKVLGAKPTAKAPTSNCTGCHQKDSAKKPSAQAAEKPAEETPEPQAEETPTQETPKADAGAAQAEQSKGPEKITIKLGTMGKKTAEFTHIAHQDYADNCKSCHHEGLEEPTCSGCHEPKESKKIYHKQCIGCHKENGASTKCSFCHPK